MKPNGRRLCAGALCRERGWGKGTVLRSSRWNASRVVTDVGPVLVELKRPGYGGSSVFAKTLPNDVEEALR